MISSIKNNKGSAILLATFAATLCAVIAVEISYDTSVEHVVSSHAIKRIKAHYAAKSGVELSLYRILLYKKAMAQFGDQLKDNKALIDPIWQFPFTWPPTGLEGLNEVDKQQIQDIVKESSLDAQYMSTIESEGARIDVNDLASENKSLSEGARMQLLQIFENQLESNEKFKERFENFKFEELINNIQDWVDEDRISLTTRSDESSVYDQPDGVKNFSLPPNQPFKTIEELHMVKDMDDEIYDLLKNKVTVYGTKGINVNYAAEEVLKALDPQIKEQPLAELLKRRSDPQLGGPFRDAEDFYSFLEGQGVRTENMKKSELPLLFDAEYNFRIISSGQSGNIRSEITVITYDVENLTERYSEILNKIDADKNGNGTGEGATGGDGRPSGGNVGSDKTPTPAPAKKSKVPKGRPTVVFWQET